MKRILSLVLIAVLVLGMVPFSFAEEMTAGETLKAYGVVEGYEDGTLREENALTRAQMMTILVDLFDAEDEVAVYPLSAGFVDTEGHWAEATINYAVGSGWTNGKSATTFDPDGPVTDAQLATFLMRALGYEPTDWTMAVTEIAALGVVVAPTAEATRGAAFESIVEALDVMPKDQDMTLGSKLELPTYEPPYVAPETLEVVSVEAINLFNLEVTFNQAVDADTAEDKDNYDLDAPTTTAAEVAYAELAEDGMTVVLTLTTGLEQQEEVDLTIDTVEDLEENAIDEVTFEDIEALDTTLPAAVDAEVVGIDTIKVTFSESIETVAKADFEIDGGDYYVQSVSFADNAQTEVNVVLYSDLEAGDVEVEVGAGVEDFAGFGVLKETFTVTVEEDTDAPVVVDYKNAKPGEVTLVFNEDIEIASTDADDFYHTNSNNAIDAIGDATVVGNELTLEFKTDSLPEGTAYVYIAKEAINDLWDNENAKIVVEVTVTVDEVAPTVEKVEVKDEDQIKVTFDEVVTETSAEDTDNYTLLDEDGDEVEDAIDSIAWDSTDEDFVLINFEDDLSGIYTIVIEDVEDAAGNESASESKEFEVDDLTAPDFADFTATIYNESAEDQMIKVDFDEEMATEGKYSVLDLEKYVVGTTLLADITDATIVAVDGGEAVEITIPSDADVTGGTNGEDYVDLTASMDIQISRVADAADNYTAALSSGALDLAAAGTVDFEAEATAADTIVVTFDDELVKVEADDLRILDGLTEVTPAKVKSGTDSDGNTTLTFTLAEADEMTSDATGASTMYVDTVATASENVYGEKIANQTVTVADGIAPAVVMYDHDTDNATADVAKVTAEQNVVSIEFEENINIDEILYTDWTVQGATVESIAISGGDTLVITLEADDTVEAGDSVSGTISDGTNDDADFSEDIAVVTDTTGPVIESVSISADNTELTIKFNEGVYAANDGTGALVEADFDALDGGARVDDVVSVTHTAGSKTVTVVLDLNATPAVGTETITVDAVAASIYDAAGNAAAAGQDVDVTMKDLTAATGTGAAVDNNAAITSLVVTFDEALSVDTLTETTVANLIDSSQLVASTSGNLTITSVSWDNSTPTAPELTVNFTSTTFTNTETIDITFVADSVTDLNGNATAAMDQVTVID